MTGTSWVLKGTEYANCNCDYGCPCQFNGRPSSVNGDCRYALFTQIDEGHYGEVKLDGLRFIWLGGWPGAVHEGNGVIQLIIDEGADDAQREAIRRIVYNEDTDEMLTHYFGLLCHVHDDPRTDFRTHRAGVRCRSQNRAWRDPRHCRLRRRTGAQPRYRQASSRADSAARGIRLHDA